MGLYVVSTLVVNGAICCFNLTTLVVNGGNLLFQPYILGGECFFFNHKTLVANEAILLIQSYILGGEWGYFLFQPWWYIELFVDSTLHH